MENLTKRSSMRSFSLRSWFLCACVSVGLLSSCASDTSYDRHNKSRLWVTQDGKQLYFDATVSAQYPADDAEAEAARRGWLADWLKIREYCADGYNVIERREIRADEYNPQRHDLRYAVECH